MKADEAHKIAEEKVSQAVESTINIILPAIKETAEKGQFSLAIPKDKLGLESTTNPVFLARMRKMGYNAQYIWSDGDSHYLISW
mgnify:CR=1 FL=1